MEEKFCSYCGKSLVQDSMFCSSCGRKIYKEKSSLTKTPPPSNIKPTFLEFFFSFNGRIGRLTYWGAGMIIAIVQSLANMAFKNIQIGVNDDRQTLLFFTGIALTTIVLWSTLATVNKRWHDLDKSPWWSLTIFVPIWGFITLFQLLFSKGTDGGNKYGDTTESNQAIEQIGIVIGILTA